jgi:hypothetical protein
MRKPRGEHLLVLMEPAYEAGGERRADLDILPDGHRSEDQRRHEAVGP